MRKSVDSALRFGCKGIKVRVSGRLNGTRSRVPSGICRDRLPLHTLRADIDYGFAEANTTYGKIGVKTWVYKGDIYEQKKRRDNTRRRPAHSKECCLERSDKERSSVNESCPSRSRVSGAGLDAVKKCSERARRLASAKAGS